MLECLAVLLVVRRIGYRRYGMSEAARRDRRIRLRSLRFSQWLLYLLKSPIPHISLANWRVRWHGLRRLKNIISFRRWWLSRAVCGALVSMAATALAAATDTPSNKDTIGGAGAAPPLPLRPPPPPQTPTIGVLRKPGFSTSQQ